MTSGFARLTGPVTLAGRTAQSRVMFGPHETNLGSAGQPGAGQHGPGQHGPGLGAGRAFSPRHVAYFQRRAAGGAGLIVTETASVHRSDWPYERAPLAGAAADGWRQIAAACQPYGTLVLAGLGHTGLQGSSAYSQAVLWGPSGVPDPVTREVPMEMGGPEISALTAGFAAAAGAAVAAGADGVEIDAGPGGLLRQFHSGLTNDRADGYGADRLRLTREVLAAVRDAIGPGHVLGLRLSCDELAPWAGVTPEAGAEHARELSRWLDLLVVVRGGPYSASAYRPDAHTAPLFNLALAGQVRDALAGAALVVLQGSVADARDARDALDGGACDLVEMTRAQIADAGLVTKREIGCAAVVDCGHRLADTALYEAAQHEAAQHEAAQHEAAQHEAALHERAQHDEARPVPGQPGVPRAGDCVAPRTAAEAVLEGRRRAQEIGAQEAGDRGTAAAETGALDTSALEREQPPPAAPAPNRQPAAR